MKTHSRKLLPILAVSILVVAVALYFVIRLLAGGPASRPILLGGTIVTPDTVIQDGWVLVRNGRIDLVSASKPDALDAIEVDTGGIIFPGLIDLHNHVSWDVLPRWHPPHLFSDRYAWRTDPDYVRNIAGPYQYLLDHKYFCDMNTYGELRALAGGTTSILATADAGCIRGLVRNLDFSSGFYGWFESDRAHIRDEIEMRATTDPAVVQSVRSFLAGSRAEAFIVHSAEGIDATSLDEFYFLKDQGLLTHKTVLVQGVALGAPEFRDMQTVGASLVWSPRSNIELYGKTADIPAALDAGVRVALAPDWGITGGSSMLDELNYAARWNADHFSGRLTDQQLVMMVTAIPAQLAGIDDEVGAIRAGLYADLLVISGDRTDPYRALVEAQPGDVQLVLIGGQAVYGEPALMSAFWKPSRLNELVAGGVKKVVVMPNPSTHFNDLTSRLQAAIASQGSALAPLTESR
jgi:hypothetical protein